MPCPNYRRKRTISKAFRVSPEENERIELLSKTAGVTQQQYIMTRFKDKEFTIVLDIRTYKMLRDEMRAVYQELSRIRDCSKMDEQLAARVDLLSLICLQTSKVKPYARWIKRTLRSLS